jgi:hypothetical protein
MRHAREFQACFKQTPVARGRVDRPSRSERKARRKIRRKESSSEAFFYVAAKAATHKNRPSFLRASRDAAPGEFQACLTKLRCRARRLATRCREESRQKLAAGLLLESEREISYHFGVERVLEISPRTSTQHPGPQLGTKPGGTKR